MTGAYFHLVLNHIPLIALPVALIFLVFSRLKEMDELRRLALVVLAVSALLVIPVYLTGESAEGFIETLPGMVKSDLHDHEEAAEVALVLGIFSGLLSIVTLALERYWQSARVSASTLQWRVRWLTTGVILLVVVTVGSLGYASNLGGKIRRPELRSNTFSTQEAPPAARDQAPNDGHTEEPHEEHDDHAQE
ncbi:MAG: hypothetical protein KGQ59_04255 [Bdellovibrionales bacterium]|nr:hypothetical protein [Bdellovibrionales bacterium]